MRKLKTLFWLLVACVICHGLLCDVSDYTFFVEVE